MLRSSKCLLNGKTERELAAMKECPQDPGGYFIVKGVEKAILIQEQLSKNRVIIEQDPKGNPCASITSSTRERKSKGYILAKKGKLYMKHNTLADDIPIAICLKAMGIESDIELVQLVGSDPEIVDYLALSLEEPVRLGLSTQMQALRYIGNKIRNRSMNSGYTSYRKPQSPEDEAREVLANVTLSHIPVINFDFHWFKIIVPESSPDGPEIIKVINMSLSLTAEGIDHTAIKTEPGYRSKTLTIYASEVQRTNVCGLKSSCYSF